MPRHNLRYEWVASIPLTPNWSGLCYSRQQFSYTAHHTTSCIRLDHVVPDVAVCFCCSPSPVPLHSRFYVSLCICTTENFVNNSPEHSSDDPLSSLFRLCRRVGFDIRHRATFRTRLEQRYCTLFIFASYGFFRKKTPVRYTQILYDVPKSVCITFIAFRSASSPNMYRLAAKLHMSLWRRSNYCAAQVTYAVPSHVPPLECCNWYSFG